MNIKIKTLFVSLVFAFMLSLIVAPQAFAIQDPGDGGVATPTPAQADPSSCAGGNSTACLKSGSTGSIMNVITIGINLLAGSVLVIATASIIFAGIQYTTSNGDPQATTKAKQRITNAIFGLVAFFFLWAFLQWLIPGGVWGL